MWFIICNYSCFITALAVLKNSRQIPSWPGSLLAFPVLSRTVAPPGKWVLPVLHLFREWRFSLRNPQVSLRSSQLSVCVCIWNENVSRRPTGLTPSMSVECHYHNISDLSVEWLDASVFWGDDVGRVIHPIVHPVILCPPVTSVCGYCLNVWFSL